MQYKRLFSPTFNLPCDLNINCEGVFNPFVFNQDTLPLPPENIRRPYGFLLFSGVRERVYWERMG